MNRDDVKTVATALVHLAIAHVLAIIFVLMVVQVIVSVFPIPWPCSSAE